MPPDLVLASEANVRCLQETAVEQMLESALAKSERPWLILLSGLSAAIVVLLLIVYYKLEQP